MRYLPYQFVALSSLMVAFFVGALLQIIHESAHINAQAEIMISLPVNSLSQINTGHDI